MPLLNDQIKMMHTLYGEDSEHECRECWSYIIKHNRLDHTCIWYAGKVKEWKPAWTACGLFEPKRKGAETNEQT